MKQKSKKRQGPPSAGKAPRRCRECARLNKALVLSWNTYISDTERLAVALRRINESLGQFDSATYASARAYSGHVLLMRQTVDAALNPSRTMERGLHELFGA